MRVLRNGLIVARTLVFDNNLDPEFDEIVYCPVHSMSEALILEAMDYQHNSKPRPLGQTKLSIRELVTEGPDKKEEPYVSRGTLQRSDNLQSEGGRSVKGTLVYEASFFPTVHLRGVQFASAAANPLERVQAAPGEGNDNESYVEPTMDDTATLPDNEDDELSRQMNAEAAQGRLLKRTDTMATTGSSPIPPNVMSHKKNALSTASAMTAMTMETTASITDGVSLSKEEILQSRE